VTAGSVEARRRLRCVFWSGRFKLEAEKSKGRSRKIRVGGSALSCPVRRSYSKGEFRSIIGSSIIGIWAISREMGLVREIGTYRIFYNFMVEDGQCMCKSRTMPRDGSSA